MPKEAAYAFRQNIKFKRSEIVCGENASEMIPQLNPIPEFRNSNNSLKEKMNLMEKKMNNDERTRNESHQTRESNDSFTATSNEHRGTETERKTTNRLSMVKQIKSVWSGMVNKTWA